jgi:hypothetical protein
MARDRDTESSFSGKIATFCPFSPPFRSIPACDRALGRCVTVAIDHPGVPRVQPWPNENAATVEPVSVQFYQWLDRARTATRAAAPFPGSPLASPGRVVPVCGYPHLHRRDRAGASLVPATLGRQSTSKSLPSPGHFPDVRFSAWGRLGPRATELVDRSRRSHQLPRIHLLSK